MNFNNPSNRCSLTGYICSDFIFNDRHTILELRLGVERKSETIGGKIYTDYFAVFISKRQCIALIETTCRKGSVITVKGEMRNWNDGSMKLCADSITIRA